MIDKESALLLQRIDCNCNDCKFMTRDFNKLKAHRESYAGTGLMDKMEFGNCSKLSKPVSFIPVTCMIETQICFVHRKD